MSDSLARFTEVLKDSHAWMRQYKARSGRKVAGFFCDYTPEEVLYAAGFIPVRITGGRGNVVAADKHLQSNVCSFARRCFDQALEGVYDYLDALVVPHTCDVITKMYDLWAYRKKDPQFVHYVWVPHKVFDPAAVAVMEGELKRLKKCLEEYIGKTITDEELQEAVSIYNESRSLLRRVYELRRSDPPLISGAQAFALSLSSMLVPKELHNTWVKAFLAEQEGRNSALASRPRVLVSASVLDDLALIQAVEEAGAWVVADDVCTGSRYFFDLVQEEAKGPLRALTNRYLTKLPCPRSVGSLEPRYKHISRLAREYQVQGILFYILRCCDAHQFQYPVLNKRLQDEGYKTLWIQGDQTMGINEQVVNRIKAFTEILSS